MFSFTYNQTRCFREIDNKQKDTNEQLRKMFFNLIKFLKKKFLSPGRISGMNLFSDFED
jgi:hypothetical protein